MAKRKLVVIQAKVPGQRDQILKWNMKQWRAEGLSERQIHLKRLNLLATLSKKGIK